MFTVCSKCNLRLTVTPADLRAAQGYVRCGRCHNVFNALAALSEETPDSTGEHRTNTAAPAPQAATPSPAPAVDPAVDPGPADPVPESDSAPPSPQATPDPDPGAMPPPGPGPDTADTQPPADRVQTSAPPAPGGADTDLEFNASSTDVSSIFVTAPTAPHTGTFESIILRGGQAAQGPADVNVTHLPATELAALAAVAEQAVREQGAAGDDPLELASLEPDPLDVQLADPPPSATLEEPEEPTWEGAGPALDEFAVQDIALDAVDEPVAVGEPAVAVDALPEPGPEAIEPETPDEPGAQAGDGTTAADGAVPAAGMAPDTTRDAAHDAPQQVLQPDPQSARQTDEQTDPQSALQSDIAAAAAAIDADPLTAAAPPPPASRLPAWLTTTACVLLALILVAQAVHHWRDSLATGPLGRPLTALYAALGRPLSPHWDVSGYEVRQLGAQAAEPGGNLEIHAAIRNRARRAQPLPLLRVTLEDQFGNRIAARDLTPAEYQAHAAAGASLAPGARVDATATFVDPGQAAVGFELDACLKLRAGRTVCANDPARPAP